MHSGGFVTSCMEMWQNRQVVEKCPDLARGLVGDIDKVHVLFIQDCPGDEAPHAIQGHHCLVDCSQNLVGRGQLRRSKSN